MLTFLNQWAGIVCSVCTVLIFCGLDAKRIAAALHGKSGMSAPQPRSRIILLLVIVSCVWSGITTYRLHYEANAQDIPEFDAPDRDIYLGYTHTPTSCIIAINGERFWQYETRYRVAAGCLSVTPSIDELDTPLLVGNPHDILRGPMQIQADFGNPLDPTMPVTFLLC